MGKFPLRLLLDIGKAMSLLKTILDFTEFIDSGAVIFLSKSANTAKDFIPFYHAYSVTQAATPK